MIIQHLSWQQFLVAALVFSTLWYLALLVIYRREIFQWLQKRWSTQPIEPLRKPWADELEEGPGDEAVSPILGAPKLPEGLTRVSMHELRFAGPDETITNESGPDAANPRERQLGLVPDAIEELKHIFQLLEQEQGSKADFISLFALVKTKYAALRGTASQEALNDWIREHALFPIADAELDQLWN